MVIRDNTLALKELTEDEKKKLKAQTRNSNVSRKEESVHIKIDKD